MVHVVLTTAHGACFVPQLASAMCATTYLDTRCHCCHISFVNAVSNGFYVLIDYHPMVSNSAACCFCTIASRATCQIRKQQHICWLWCAISFSMLVL
jgi:hypothetical protein